MHAVQTSGCLHVAKPFDLQLHYKYCKGLGLTGLLGLRGLGLRGLGFRGLGFRILGLGCILLGLIAE